MVVLAPISTSSSICTMAGVRDLHVAAGLEIELVAEAVRADDRAAVDDDPRADDAALADGDERMEAAVSRRWSLCSPMKQFAPMTVRAPMRTPAPMTACGWMLTPSPSDGIGRDDGGGMHARLIADGRRREECGDFGESGAGRLDLTMRVKVNFGRVLGADQDGGGAAGAGQRPRTWRCRGRRSRSGCGGAEIVDAGDDGFRAITQDGAARPARPGSGPYAQSQDARCR